MNQISLPLKELTRTTDWPNTFKAWLFGVFKVPLLFFVRPRIALLDSTQVVFRIPLLRRNQNHLKSMYFGTLAIGADLAAGFLAFERIRASGKNISMVFKDVKGEFLKRVEGPALFHCQGGAAMDTLVQKALTSGERVEDSLDVLIYVPTRLGDEVAARFTLTISLKLR